MAVNKISSTTHFFQQPGGGEPTTGRWTPHTDIYVTETGLVIKAELAGMKSDSLEITVEGQRLRINGVRPDCCRAPQCSFLVMEISYGPFETVLDLPPGYDFVAGESGLCERVFTGGCAAVAEAAGQGDQGSHHRRSLTALELLGRAVV